ncbi:HmuY family protein [Sphingobacterium psychroaquaticum]|uniref:HmuY protein n=1 Tax=Sphingobacterium psychroaquaticum TaxID=561061 RepID=A0A1X7JL61_9SPHI|nr:HmuY family protein [Sphingobacterium psychroaquaticum]SMG28544.1 HmuY protein [Sphingobacterium psychroaquaticum]
MKLRKLFTPRSPKRYYTIVMCLLVLTGSSCSKNNDTTPDDETPTDEHMFNRLITVSNFGESLPEGAAPDSEQEPIFFSLEQNQAVNQSLKRTNRWDLSFSSVYRSYVGGNNGSDKFNFGFGGPGQGAVLLVKKKFEDVIDIPKSEKFNTLSDAFGPDENGDIGQTIGWYLYDFSGLLVRDGEFDNQHIAYALHEELPITTTNGVKKTIEPRTIILRTAKGNYAKIRIRSLYKNELKKENWKRKTEKPFFTFDYVLAKAGSTKFEIKN